jgi:hypothetical protein
MPTTIEPVVTQATKKLVIVVTTLDGVVFGATIYGVVARKKTWAKILLTQLRIHFSALS